jgi:Family of unknown function (DUF5994)
MGRTVGDTEAITHASAHAGLALGDVATGLRGFYGHIMTTLHRPSPPHTRPPTSSGEARISFRKPVSESGYVNAAWWPRSRDLAAELPALFDVLRTAYQDVDRVSYNLPFWQPTPRRMRIDKRVVRVRGYHIQNPLVLTVFDPSGEQHINILVVRPEADADFAERVLQLAGGVGSLEQPDRILKLAAMPDGKSARSDRP